MASSAWETINNNRRREPRHKVRLTASVSLIGQEIEESQTTTVLAYTRDISKAGLCLVMPSSHMGCHNLEEGNHVLRIVLVLPAGTSVRMEGQLMYCLPFDAEGFGGGYLSGVKLTESSPEDYTLYHDFIETLNRR
jgi:hypothetical protein